MSGVLVVVEHRSGDGSLTRVSREALAAGQVLAKQLGSECFAAVLGENTAALAGALSGQRLAKVYAVDHPLLQQYTADAYTSGLEQIVARLAPEYVVFPHTYQVRDFAPALATRFGEVLISDVIAIRDGPVFVRQLFQGKLNADYTHTGGGPCFVSIQAGAFRADAVERGRISGRHRSAGRYARTAADSHPAGRLRFANLRTRSISRRRR